MSQLWGWGLNAYGQLGNDTAGLNYSSPVQTADMSSDWKFVTGSQSSNSRTYAIKNDGTAWAWGYNFDGYLGVSVVGLFSSPVQVIGAETWKDLSAGFNHVVALNSNNTLWAWGSNYQGQLGNNDTSNQSSPIIISAETNWTKVFCGEEFSAALKSDGSLWTWGKNNAGQLGINNLDSVSSPVQVAGSWSSFVAAYSHMGGIKNDGTLWMWGYNSVGQIGNDSALNQSSPVQIGLDTNWSYVNVGYAQSGAIKSDGSLWMWGNNYAGELGINDSVFSVSSPVQVVAATTWIMFASGSGHAVGLDTNNAVWTWGGNPYGQLGDNSNINSSSPIQILAGALNWSSIAAGHSNTFVLKGFNTTPSPTPTESPTPTPTGTPTPSASSSVTPTPTATPAPTAPSGITPTPTATFYIDLTNKFAQTGDIPRGMIREGVEGSMDSAVVDGASEQRGAYLTFDFPNTKETKIVYVDDGDGVNLEIEKLKDQSWVKKI